ncbi:MAG: NHLP family bacteriocin export ABC transporter peptidase/permease/ATPase subunit [Selenomonas sp.]|uniref:NHLP family bacteriocin export ABC transporter peptidase/permease/ATPase subunit n=1 Tax=Selenomonas sp. TaxID=2053611 RepID=UPI0025F9D88B|nr:NHLP family bacteriocin export ABC transporter peptidase/permease/ATPase subunit [Selenomonas sp.]MCR5758001.1 NHLP family bacteriocin export ABC transporter peptidase/permease/ATPase subunit [Selenomonas sp.]
MDFLQKLFNRPGARVKVPTILQMEATECGAAALAMVLAHYGLWIPLEKLRSECGVNRDGSKASNVMRAAKARGCEVHGYRWEAESLREEKDYPLIIHWEFNHFLVLEGIIGDTVYLNDPAMGRRTVPWSEFITSYTGIALTIRPSTGFKPAGHRYNVFKDVRKKLLEDKWGMSFLILLGVCMIVPGLAAPVFSQVFMDEILTGKHRDWMGNMCLAMTISFIVSAAMTWLRSWLLTRWQRKLTLADSSSFFWHLLRLPMQFFHQRYAAEVAGRISMNESVAGVLSGSAATAVLDAFVALFFLLLLLQYNVLLTFIGIVFMIINLAVLLLTRRHLTDLAMRIQQDAGKAYGASINGLTMIDSIKANGNEGDFFMKWAGYRSKVLNGMQETQLWMLSVTMLPTLLSGLNGALIMTFGGFSIMDGAMTAGMFVAFQHLMGSFQAPVGNLTGLYTSLQSTEMQMQRLNDVRRYDVDDLNYPQKTPSGFTKQRLSGELELKDICFGYSPLEPPLLTDFNLHLKPGRWVAIVGASGSGKSTVAKVITGLYEEWSGQVLMDGTPRRQIPRSVITTSLSAVDQDVFQITGTVGENIALFDNSLRQSDIVRAAKDACIHEDILQLEGGYEAKVSEGGLNFSGGQRQRLEIARALVVNPSILVLDEATSALDPLTEEKVLNNIRHRGCACVIIAHRLSTIRDADEIIVLERGQIVERGRHREMMMHDGPYRRLIEEHSAK